MSVIVVWTLWRIIIPGIKDRKRDKELKEQEANKLNDK